MTRLWKIHFVNGGASFVVGGFFYLVGGRGEVFWANNGDFYF